MLARTPSRLGLAVALALAVTIDSILAGCGGDTGDAGDELRLRPGFRILAKTDGPPHRQLSGLGRQTEGVVLHDVSIAHGRIVLATVHGIYSSFPTWHPNAVPEAPPTLSGVEAGQSDARLHISDDGGVSWRGW